MTNTPAPTVSWLAYCRAGFEPDLAAEFSAKFGATPRTLIAAPLSGFVLATFLQKDARRAAAIADWRDFACCLLSGRRTLGKPWPAFLAISQNSVLFVGGRAGAWDLSGHFSWHHIHHVGRQSAILFLVRPAGDGVISGSRLRTQGV